MSADKDDIAAVDPVLMLSVDPPSVLRCVGTLDGKTGISFPLIDRITGPDVARNE